MVKANCCLLIQFLQGYGVGALTSHGYQHQRGSTLNRPVKAIHYQLAPIGDEVPLADYATYGSQELADHATNALGQGGAVLLKNHGLMTVADTIETAYRHALDVEWVAKLYYLALQIGEPDILTHDEMARVRHQLAHYGQAGSQSE